MFSDVVECYAAIGNALDSSMRERWTRIFVEATLVENRVDVVVSYWSNTTDQPAGYLTGIPMLARYIYELARLVSNEEKGFFRKFYFDMQSDGKYDAKFEY